MRKLHMLKTMGWCALVLSAAAFVAGCSSGSSGGGGGAAPEVTVDVSSASINVTDSDDITATSTDPSDTSFIWTVDVPGAVSITSVDTIDAVAQTLTSVATVTGIYPGAVTITATADPSGLLAEIEVTVINVAPVVRMSVEGLSHHDINDLDFAGAGLDPALFNQSSALTNVPVGTYAYFTANATDSEDDPLTYTWVVTAPDASDVPVADLPDTGDDQAIYFLVDQTGSYTVELSVDDGVNDPVRQTTTVTSGTWVGAGIVHNDTSPPTISASPCTSCHALGGGGFAPDMFTTWLETGHATKVATELDGAYYSESCMSCHTVGWDDLADNGGFDDLLATSSWTFPDPIGPGEYQNLIDTDPTLAALANIQCENCHGPASGHTASGSAALIDVSLDTGVCGQCHGEPWRHPRAVEWEYSGHSHEDSEAFRHWDDEEDDPDTDDVDETGMVSESCAKCHSGRGFIEFSKNFTDAEWEAGVVEPQVHSCAVCHDPHGNENPAELRVYGSTLVPTTIDGESSWAEMTGLGASATCITCHNGRRTPASGRTPHYLLGGAMMLGINGVEYGATINDSYHSTSLGNMVTIDGEQEEFGCPTCHMAPSTALYGDAEAHEFEHMVGQHSLNMTYEGFENVEMACARCHTGLDAYNRLARGDYDGDETTEGIQDEVAGLLEAVTAAVVALGAEDLGHYPYWDYDGVAEEDLASVKDAVWNIENVSNEGSLGIHNTGYAVGLLQASYNDLTGTDISSDLRYE